jgi:hypothetical protein
LRVGLLSDCTHKYFSSGYLLSTLVLCPTLTKWVGVAYSWVEAQTAEHMASHFYIVSMALWRSLDPKLSEEQARAQYEGLAMHVMDYSEALRKAWYMGHRRATFEFYSGKGWLAEASTYLQETQLEFCRRLLIGCLFHYEQSSERIRKNQAVVSLSKQEQWQNLTREWAKTGSADRWEEIRSKLLKSFPRAKNWITWWTRDEIKAICFPPFMSSEKKEKVDSKAVKRDTNPIESSHSKIKRIEETGNSKSDGFGHLIDASDKDWQDRERTIQGNPRDYGNWNKIIERITSTAKKDTRNKKRQRDYSNDGRAPDTIRQLIGKDAKKVKKEVKEELETKKVQEPVKEEIPKTMIKVKKPGPGRPKGGTNTQNAPGVSYRSFVWQENSCFYNPLLEVLASIFANHRQYFERLLVWFLYLIV